jgi:hypothetical protein
MHTCNPHMCVQGTYKRLVSLALRRGDSGGGSGGGEGVVGDPLAGDHSHDKEEAGACSDDGDDDEGNTYTSDEDDNASDDGDGDGGSLEDQTRLADGQTHAGKQGEVQVQQQQEEAGGSKQAQRNKQQQPRLVPYDLPDELAMLPDVVVGFNMGLTCPDYAWAPSIDALHR